MTDYIAFSKFLNFCRVNLASFTRKDITISFYIELRRRLTSTRTILTLYVMNILALNATNATILFHAFIVLCYTSPLVGSTLADGYIGNGLDLFGLVIIAIGTGGIKPCVAAFGGDQFNPRYTTMISMFFSIFYFTINAGSTISNVKRTIVA
uniref:Amino acid permease/ SLC12A domain-containing protein n=1 Tax=Parascaris equorum TaxID=6256 RepID=A0A914S3B0_PAREQ